MKWVLSSVLAAGGLIALPSHDALARQSAPQASENPQAKPSNQTSSHRRHHHRRSSTTRQTRHHKHSSKH
jgi:hypothetical protein